MIRIYQHEDRFMVWQVKQWLDSHGIPCFIKNEFASGALGELAPFDTSPEVWLNDDEWQPRASQLIEQLTFTEQSSKPWQCSACGESNEASFDMCWQCGWELV